VASRNATRAQCETVLAHCTVWEAPGLHASPTRSGDGDRACAVLDHAARTEEGVISDEALSAALPADDEHGLAAAVFRYLGTGPRVIHRFPPT
jgi:hypothetical protein